MTINSNKRVNFTAIILIATFTLGFYIGKYNTQGNSNNNQTTTEYNLINRDTIKKDVDFDLFWEAWDQIENNYIDKNDLNTEQMVWGAISGMVNSLDDPHTSFLNREDNKEFNDDINGSFEGIGAEIGIHKGQLKIIAPLKNTPAEKSGLRAGDVILQIDDIASADITLDKAVSLIRGPKKTIVKLLIYRDDWNEPKEIQIQRDTIQIPVVEYELLKNQIAHINIYSFTDSLDNLYAQTVQKVLKDNAKGVILDLRNNPGGLLNTAVEVTSYHLKKDKIILNEEFSNGIKQVYRSAGYNTLGDIPTVILINEGSASASEIMAGALRDNKNTKLIGEKSYGKGSVQQLYNLKDGSSLKITIAKWFTPNGNSINDLGLEPDIKISLTDDDIKQGKDPQLTKAIEILSNLAK